jgi:6-phosphogluconate dehydrogenase
MGGEVLKQVGLLGLGVMGRALAANFRDQGCTVHAFDPSADARRQAAADGTLTANGPAELVQRLDTPRAILMLVPAGAPVDTALGEIGPMLQRGDLVADLGNSHWRDDLRRAESMAGRGVTFIGIGVSGGEAGARAGPAIMAGAPEAAWDRLRGLLEAAAASYDGEPCCARVGPDGSGHFVKMVHNGIEYAVMQLIAESFDLMQRVLGLPIPAAQARFASWAQGEHGSYLLEITADVLGLMEPVTGGPIIDVIDDAAGQKGTGAWASIAALELGVPANVLVEAVLARGISGRKADRRAMRERLAAAGKAGKPAGGAGPDISSLEQALWAGTVVAYAQGLDLIRAASEAYAWDIDLTLVARIWRAGCIIRSRLLGPILDAVGEARDHTILAAPGMARQVGDRLPALRAVVAAASESGVPVPCLAAALASVDAMLTGRLPTRLIQAQRDHFGRHGFGRIDAPGQHHLPPATPP